VPARHDLFLILAVLGPGSNGPSPHRLGPGRPGMTHWPDILAYQVHTTPFSVFRFNSTYSISSHHSQFSYSHSSVFIFNITYLTTHILSFQIRHGSVFIFNNTYSTTHILSFQIRHNSFFRLTQFIFDSTPYIKPDIRHQDHTSHKT
jgi:hypothetical protein